MPRRSAESGPATPEAILGRLERFGIRLGLDATSRLLDRLGQPHRGIRSVLVAGTNGKGSTAAMLESIARRAGYRTGLYTSPHLESPVERIRVDGRAIEEADLAEVLERILAVAEENGDAPPTYFEALTAAALIHFREQAVELSILEVGMGGRLDATNVVQPDLSIVASIGLDHQEHLGSDLASIATEKAGIFRQGRPAIASRGNAGWPFLAAAAERIGAVLEPVEDRVRVVETSENVGIAFEVGEQRIAGPKLLVGTHQVANAGLALAATDRLREAGWDRFDATAMSAGLAGAQWPGRLEWVALPETGRGVLIDGAHNVDGARALAQALVSQAGPWDLLFAARADKPAEEMLRALGVGARRITLTLPPGGGHDPKRLASALDDGFGSVETIPDAAAALDTALEAEPRVLVVAGSLYLAGAARLRLRARFGVPGPATDPL